ncbi:MAG: hypothetical protein WB392_01015 [Methanotrichaceae archaeon]
MAIGRSIIEKLMLISLGAIILLSVCLGSNTGSSNTFDAKSTYSQVIPEESQVKQDSDFNTDAASLDLTGTWACDDGSKYYIRQIGNTLAWLGESTDQSRTNVAFGNISGNTIELSWMDVPKGDSLGSGTLTLSIDSNDKMTLVQKTGDFYGTEWTRSTTYVMSDLKMSRKTIDMNTSGIDLHPSFPDLFESSNPGSPSSGIERVSLNPQPEPPIPTINPLKTFGAV